jgi:hypothetical protein
LKTKLYNRSYTVKRQKQVKTGRYYKVVYTRPLPMERQSNAALLELGYFRIMGRTLRDHRPHLSTRPSPLIGQQNSLQAH